MSTSNFRYGYIEDVERLECYKPGGYHPIHIDDRLHNRYKIVHKLGHGTFSTAWLAFDELTSKFVAVKVCTAESENREVDILSELSIPTTKGPKVASDKYNKSSMIPTLLDRFSIDGPNGTHLCLVTAPARCSLRESKEESRWRLFQLSAARSLAAQLVLAVSFVHSRGYAHGDLHFGNILLKLPSSLNNLSVSELYTKFGEPDPEPIVRLNAQNQPDTSSPKLEAGVPSHAIPPIWLGIASDALPLNEAQILLTDFGTAFRPSEKSRFESYTPLIIRPPEAYFEPTTPLSFPSDIWSLACVIFELFAHRSLIDGYFLPTQDDITAQQVHLQGPMPDEWWGKFENREEWFDEDGTSRSKEGDVWGWDKTFDKWVQEPRADRGMEVIGQEERLALLEMLQSMLTWRPSERPGIDEVLETTWMKRWGLPAYEEGLRAESSLYAI